MHPSGARHLIYHVPSRRPNSGEPIGRDITDTGSSARWGRFGMGAIRADPRDGWIGAREGKRVGPVGHHHGVRYAGDGRDDEDGGGDDGRDERDCDDVEDDTGSDGPWGRGAYSGDSAGSGDDYGYDEDDDGSGHDDDDDDDDDNDNDNGDGDDDGDGEERRRDTYGKRKGKGKGEGNGNGNGNGNGGVRRREEETDGGAEGERGGGAEVRGWSEGGARIYGASLGDGMEGAGVAVVPTVNAHLSPSPIGLRHHTNDPRSIHECRPDIPLGGQVVPPWAIGSARGGYGDCGRDGYYDRGHADDGYGVALVETDIPFEGGDWRGDVIPPEGEGDDTFPYGGMRGLHPGDPVARMAQGIESGPRGWPGSGCHAVAPRDHTRHAHPIDPFIPDGRHADSDRPWNPGFSPERLMPLTSPCVGAEIFGDTPTPEQQQRGARRDGGWSECAHSGHGHHRKHHEDLGWDRHRHRRHANAVEHGPLRFRAPGPRSDRIEEGEAPALASYPFGRPDMARHRSVPEGDEAPASARSRHHPPPQPQSQPQTRSRPHPGAAGRAAVGAHKPGARFPTTASSPPSLPLPSSPQPPPRDDDPQGTAPIRVARECWGGVGHPIPAYRATRRDQGDPGDLAGKAGYDSAQGSAAGCGGTRGADGRLHIGAPIPRAGEEARGGPSSPATPDTPLRRPHPAPSEYRTGVRGSTSDGEGRAPLHDPRRPIILRRADGKTVIGYAAAVERESTHPPSIGSAVASHGGAARGIPSRGGGGGGGDDARGRKSRAPPRPPPPSPAEVARAMRADAQAPPRPALYTRSNVSSRSEGGRSFLSDERAHEDEDREGAVDPDETCPRRGNSRRMFGIQSTIYRSRSAPNGANGANAGGGPTCTTPVGATTQRSGGAAPEAQRSAPHSVPSGVATGMAEVREDVPTAEKAGTSPSGDTEAMQSLRSGGAAQPGVVSSEPRHDAKGEGGEGGSGGEGEGEGGGRGLLAMGGERSQCPPSKDVERDCETSEGGGGGGVRRSDNGCISDDGAGIAADSAGREGCTQGGATEVHPDSRNDVVVVAGGGEIGIGTSGNEVPLEADNDDATRRTFERQLQGSEPEVRTTSRIDGTDVPEGDPLSATSTPSLGSDDGGDDGSPGGLAWPVGVETSVAHVESLSVLERDVGGRTSHRTALPPLPSTRECTCAACDDPFRQHAELDAVFPSARDVLNGYEVSFEEGTEGAEIEGGGMD